MFKTQRVPVTLFQSTDVGAPQLTAAAGSFKTILKACLVSGYGDKKALDWESAFEDDQYIAFRSKSEKSNKCWLSVDNKHARSANLCGYISMSAKNTGQEQFAYSTVPLMENGINGAKWALIGHSRAFVIVIDNPRTNSSYGMQYIYFGDFNSIAAAGVDCVLIKRAGYQTDNSDYLGKYSGAHGLSNVVSDGFPGSWCSSIAKAYDGLRSGAELSLGSAGFVRSGMSSPYPSVVSQGFSAFDVFVYEAVPSVSGSGSTAALRGVLGGIFKVPELLTGINDLTLFDNLDNSGDKFLKFQTGRSGGNADCYLINCTAWEI